MFDTSRIHLMLDKVQAFLGQWLEEHLKQIYPTDWWDRCVMSVLAPEQREHVLDDGAMSPADLDLSMQITVFRGNWTLLRRKFHLNPQLYDDAAAVKRIRNKFSHKKSGKDYEERFDHDMETVNLFLKALGFPSMSNASLEQSSATSKSTFSNEQMFAIPATESSINAIEMLGVPKIDVNDSCASTNSAPENRNQSEASQAAPCDENWLDVTSLLYENILACLKDEFSGFNVGEILRLKRGDSVPNGVSLKDGWQQVVMLHIKDAERNRIMTDITEFIYGNHALTEPYIDGEWAIWQFPKPSRNETNIKLLTNVFLPKWLTQYLYRDKSLIYRTDCEAVQCNLNAGKDFSFQYLATYFPRSFAEMTSIFDYVFAAYPLIGKNLGDSVSIMDVGCGSGAAATALIWSMKKARLGQVRKVSVLGLDGNANFLDRFKEIVPALQDNWTAVKIDVHADPVNDVEAFLRQLPSDNRFDFIVSSKFIQELKENNAYVKYMSLCLGKLKPEGVLCFLENHRDGRTDEDCKIANGIIGSQVFTRGNLEFCITQIPSCPCVKETVGFQLFINQPKEVL